MDEYTRYFEFLRYCLSEEPTPPASYQEIDWERLYVFARHQTVEATYWRGIQRLDRQGLVKLSEEAVLTWMARTKKIERRNALVYQKAAWVWKNFQKEGFRSCVLKGQGNALLYPTPLMRTPGDIDIWVEGGDKKVIAYVDSIVPGMKRTYHHIDFLNAGKVPVEVHYRPSWMSNPWHNKRLQQWFCDHAEACFSNKEEEWGFCVPTYEFNCVFLLSHLYVHLLREGVGLRHLVDYHHLLSRNTAQKPPSVKTLKHLGLHGIAGAVMWVLHHHLGLSEEKLICAPDERRGRLLFREMMEGGNFGKFDERALGGDTKNAWRHNAKTALRDIRLVRYFPSECLCEPFFRIWHYFWRRHH